MSGGNTYLEEFRVGVEAGGSYGVAVVPTRRQYFAPGGGLTPGGTAVVNTVVTGDRAQDVSGRPGVSAPAGTYSLPAAADTILEFLSLGLTDTPVVTTPGGGTTTRLHTYTGPGTALKSGTLQWHDGARPWQQTGVYADTGAIALAANGEATLSGSLFGKAHTQTALTGTPTAYTPLQSAGWEVKLYIDAVSGTDNYGTTLIAAADSTTQANIPLFNNALGRLYTGANTRDMQQAVINPFQAAGSVTFRAAGARALTEYNDFVAGTYKRLRFMIGDNVILEGALTAFVTVDIQVMWTEFNLVNEEAGVRTYVASYRYIKDNTNSLALRVRAQNSRASAF
jgi:hypothetical protein